MKRIKLLLMTVLLLVSYATIQAQFVDRLGKAIKKSAEDAAVRKSEQKIDQAVSKTIDKVTDPDTYKDKNKKTDSETDDEETRETSAEQGDEGNSGKENKSVKPEEQKLESFSQYDFVPGDQILFYEDFSQDAIGDFPALWTTNSSGEVKTLNKFPGKWFQVTDKHGVFTYLNKLELPDNFILEFDYIPYFSEEDQKDNPSRVNWYAEAGLKLYQYKEGDQEPEWDNGLYPGAMGMRVFFKNGGWNMNAYHAQDPDRWGQGINSNKNPIVSEQLNHIIIWVQNRRVRIYHAGAKVIDAPTALAQNTKFSRLVFSNEHEANRPFFSNIKITTASPDVRSKLLTEGKIISYGINFDSGKDVIKPESYGAIKAIADILKENPDVKVRIIGHTDTDGQAAANLDLSKRRAAAVKVCLSKDFSIDTARIETDGKGQTEPLASNNTTEGKAKNRRVEFVKL